MATRYIVIVVVVLLGAAALLYAADYKSLVPTGPHSTSLFQAKIAAIKTCQMSLGKPNRKRIFTPSDDALIREQPVTGLGLKTLETMLRTSRERLLRRADELGVSLVVSEHDEAVDTRVLRCTDGYVDPLLERLKQVHGERK